MLFNNICVDEAIKKTKFLELNEKACQNFINTAKETEKLKALSTLSKRKKNRK